MSPQMSLLAPPSEGKIEVPVSREVLLHGASACAERGRGEPLFPHRHTPSPPAKMPEREAWLTALDFTEEARRFNQASVAVLDLSQRGGAGSPGPIGATGPGEPMLSASSRGIEVDGALATWPQLLASRAEQREIEPEVARARDLAEAYHYLDYYGGVYEEPAEGATWSPRPLIRRLAAEAQELGGDPALLQFHSDYMREGISP